MSVCIKLARGGVPGKPIYRIVAGSKGSKRDGKFLEILGQYNPNTKPASFKINEDRVKHWVERGALPTGVVADLIKKQIPNYLEKRSEHKTKKVQEARKKRKSSAKSGEKSAAKAEKKTKAKK